jgi:hypothetical protein
MWTRLRAPEFGVDLLDHLVDDRRNVGAAVDNSATTELGRPKAAFRHRRSPAFARA